MRRHDVNIGGAHLLILSSTTAVIAGASDTLLSIEVTFTGAKVASDVFTPTASSDRAQGVATGTYSISGPVDITTLVTWSSGTVGTCTISNTGGSEGQITAVSANNGTTGAATTSVITATLGAVSGNRTISVDVDRDTILGWRFPSTTYQVQTLMGIPATCGLLCQEASGNLTDFIGGVTFTANATPLYQQSDAGITRKGVGFNGGTAQRFQQSSFQNSATVSIASMGVMKYGTPGASQYLWNYGAADGCSLTSGSTSQAFLRYRGNGVILQSTTTRTGIFSRFIKRNLSGTPAVMVASDVEKISPTFAASTGTIFSVGATAGAACPHTLFYELTITGAAAEVSDATFKSWGVALGWPASWT